MPMAPSPGPCHLTDKPLPRALSALCLVTVLVTTAHTRPLDGTRSQHLHVRDGAAVVLGQVQFTPQADDRSRFALQLDPRCSKTSSCR